MEEKKILTEEELKNVTGGAGAGVHPSITANCTNPQCPYYGHATKTYTATEGEYAGLLVCLVCHMPIVPPGYTLEEYVSAMKEILSLRQS